MPADDKSSAHDEQTIPHGAGDRGRRRDGCDFDSGRINTAAGPRRRDVDRRRPGEPVRNSVVLIRGGHVEQVRTVESLTVPAGYDRISTEGIVIKDGRRYR
jgi:hypothetical protein